MRNAILALVIMLACAGPAAAQSAPPIAGKWKTDDGKAVILVAPCTKGAATYCGWINRFLVPEPAGGARDDKNPDKSLRSRKLMGVPILTGLSGNGSQWKGKGYSPEEGRHFTANVRADGSRLTLKGCVAVFCRTVVWTRAAA